MVSQRNLFNVTYSVWAHCPVTNRTYANEIEQRRSRFQRDKSRLGALSGYKPDLRQRAPVRFRFEIQRGMMCQIGLSGGVLRCICAWQATSLATQLTQAPQRAA